MEENREIGYLSDNPRTVHQHQDRIEAAAELFVEEIFQAGILYASFLHDLYRQR